MALLTCCEINEVRELEVLRQQYCALLAINAAVGGDTGSDNYTSTVTNAAGSGSIPAGVLGWSITSLSGTVTVQGQALPTGASARGGGYGGKTSTAAIAYTIAAGTALIAYDVPA